ncbi:hypothetical protein RXV86_14725 [Alisedimentitalea sp. MJ-SS2]|uniref:hypothetical protein n=1 Tax=Aliisedimentitalea sp. MJ-SS2 TaxID=3049795 RepID=UPI00291136D7|nr:hypothetical protein [Alisedimentitalea sp. MJ-SS2]MDU8928643.1 hypothetical protein [Alisedimentitalea sp. MJ-SS2]
MTVISLTSIPPRFGGLGPVLESLLTQGAEAVVLVLSRRYARFPGPVSPPPLPAGVAVLWAEDIGPAGKLIPVQRAYPGDAIAYCDDDCLYASGWLTALEDMAATGRVVAASTFEVARLKRKGELVAQGFAGVLTPAGLSFDPPPEPCRMADDLWFSAQMERQGLVIDTCPQARAKVFPQEAPNGLQEQDRATANAQAAAHIHKVLGVWPST